MTLADLREGQKGIIIKVKGSGTFRKRILEMGFVRGKEIKVIRYAPLKDPIEYELLGYQVSLRRSEAQLIEVAIFNPETAKEFNNIQNNGSYSSEDDFRTRVKELTHTINIALVGNPNCGKTTLFNFLTGEAEHVGNYSGITVDAKKSSFKKFGYKFNITDLPGTYSLTAYSPEELFVRRHLMNEMPDLIINVVDGTNLERNLYLTTQLIDMNIPTVIALNMYDEMEKRGDRLDYDFLGELLGMPVVPTVAASGKGLDKLLKTAIEVYEGVNPVVRPININYGKEVENSLKLLIEKIDIPANQWLTNRVSPRFVAVKLLEKDLDITETTLKLVNGREILDLSASLIKKLEKHLKDDTETIIADARYGFVAGALKETYTQGRVDRLRRTKLIDDIVTHKYLGFPLFFFFLWLMFQTTFKLGQYPVSWLEHFVNYVGGFLGQNMPDGMLKDLLVNGIIGGVGSVLVFLPNILILFFFISIMEDTGYMARVAFIMDKLMHRIGLHGKSFVPLLMGFGCNVPAIMATRTIENRSERLLTMLINPFMSCSARLPIYILIAGTFFPDNAGTVIFLIYITGIALAVLVAIIFKKTLFKEQEAPFVMELPPYRMPTARVLSKHIWNKGKQYLNKMGGIILVASIIIWTLETFPRQPHLEQEYQNKAMAVSTKYDSLAMQTPEKKEFYAQAKQRELDSLNEELNIHKQANTYLGKIGHWVAPLMYPLGFDWKMTVALLSGVSAKEIVVSTLGVLYRADAQHPLSERLKSALYDSGKRKGQLIFTPDVALAFLIFILIYFPCVATVTAVANESGSWKWALFMITYTTVLAWIMAYIVKNLVALFI